MIAFSVSFRPINAHQITLLNKPKNSFYRKIIGIKESTEIQHSDAIACVFLAKA